MGEMDWEVHRLVTQISTQDRTHANKRLVAGHEPGWWRQRHRARPSHSSTLHVTQIISDGCSEGFRSHVLRGYLNQNLLNGTQKFDAESANDARRHP